MFFREAENKGIDCRLFNFILDSEDYNGCHNLIDLYCVSVGEGIVEMEIPVNQTHLNSVGSVHGGIIANLLDSVMGMTLKSCDKIGVTTGLNVNYLRGAGRGDVLKGRGEITYNGKNMVFCQGQVSNQRGDLLATGQGSFYCTGDFISHHLKRLGAIEENK